MTTATHTNPAHATPTSRAPRKPAGRLRTSAWLAAALLCSLSATIAPTAHAQSSGALPIYRCVSADGTSSRVSRTPCAAGETGTAKQATAAKPQEKPAIVHQTPSAPAQPAQASEGERYRVHGTGRSGRRR